MRGKGSGSLPVYLPARITPAYAGKSFRVCGQLVFFQDHPRLCGEKAFKVPERSMKVGSPPPMRGKGGFAPCQASHLGITPAYAGKRSNLVLVISARRDHPRLCGEKTKKIPKQRYFFHQPASFSFSLQYT